MKKTLLFLLLTLTGLSVMASPVKPQKALLVAKNFMAQYVKGADQMEATVVYTHPMPKSGQPAMYAVNIGNMFVLVSADDIAHPVLGYSLSRPWPVINDERGMMNDEQPSVSKHSSFNTHHSTLPPQVASYLDDLATQIEAATVGTQRAASASDNETAAEWSQLLSLNSHLLTTTNLPDSVGPLLTTTWDQGQYYNALCPEDAAGPDGHVYTGCVATAMAQIINYWGYPIHGRGIHSYDHNIYGTLSVNYDSATYDYVHMPNALTTTSTPQEVNAVATLMRDCGVAANMGYGPNESSSYDFDARAGLINFFRLSPNLSYAAKSSFADSVWDNMLRTDISANHPIMYSGHGDVGGHSFVCDGYKTDGYFHFNFGWSGYFDGWYITSAVNGFNNNQSAILGIIPDSTANVILGQMAGKSTYKIEEALEFYHLFGRNRFPVNPNSVIDAQFQNDVVFFLQDTSSRLCVELLNYSDQTLHVANGDCTDNIVFFSTICTFAPGYISYTSPLTSTSNAIACRYIGGPSPDGFCIRVSEQDSCKMVSNIISVPDTNRVQLSWTENGNADQWDIEYGTKGFVRGTGTIITVDTTDITIEGLTAYVDYDFYIRPRCHDAWYGPYSEKTDLSYWQDYVNEQPTGIAYNSEGFAIVSTPEQLAWLLRDNGTTEKIIIAADLDMSGHRWRPVDNYWIKKIYGDGHSISNLLIREAESSLKIHVGFIGALSGSYTDTIIIRDLTFVNPIIVAEKIITDCGVLLGCLMNGYNNTPIVLNCGVNGGQIDCSASFVGGLVGKLERCDILNSYANISVKNFYIRPHTGGLVGQMDDGRIENCYTSSEIVYTPYYCSKGQVVGAVERGSLKNVYGKTSLYPFSPQINLGSATDTASFGNDYFLSTGIVFEDSLYYDLCTVLNERVISQNESTWRLWLYDSNLNCPILGDTYLVTCNNVSGLTANNVIYEGQYALRLDWDSNSAASYIVKCINKTDSTDSVRMYNVVDNPCFVSGLQLGDKYEIFVKCNCDSSQSGWGSPVTIIFDKPYWTDIVIAQPVGYEEDAGGNVTISSEEALAWFASRVNGINGNTAYDFMGKTVSLMADVDLAQYKWMPVGNTWNNDFKGVFMGNGHTVSNVYINENEDYVGFFGKLFQAKVTDVTLNNCMVKGNNYVGGLCGLYMNSEDWWNYFNYGNIIFENCNVSESYVYGKNAVGGLYGQSDISVSGVIIRNCSSSGNVFGGSNFGGLIGSVIQYGTKQIDNCFSTASVTCNHENGHGCQYYGGLIGYAYNATINNCYTAGIVDTVSIGGFMGSMIGVLDNSHLNFMYGILDTIYNPNTPWGVSSVYNTTMFYLNANLYILQNPITIENTTYTDLLSALNAWVDANDTAGIYRHWAADSANVNGGYPVFAAIPCTPATSSDSITVCDSYTWHGTVYTADTTLIDTLSTLEGCDSIVTHYLFVHHSNSASETVTACESYFFGGQWLYASGQYVDTLTNAAGCDSIATLTLTINNPIHTAVTETACDNYTWNGALLTTSGNYTYPHNDTNGCTQVDTLHLTINYSTASSETATACEAYFWNGEWRYISGQYSDTLTNAAGCDSIATLHLTINNPVHTATTATACDSYTWQEAVITTSGTYHYTHTDANGCTQDDTLYLTINYSTIGDTTATACDSFTWWNTTYTNSTNTPTHIYTNAAGCDSTVTLHLTINHSTSSILTDTACEAYFWNGEWQYTSGQYSDTTTNSVGCDSIAILNLTINNPVHTATTVTACDSYTWQEAVITTSGTYHYTHTDAHSCTQDDTLYLTINHNDTVIVDEVVCDSLTWYGTTYTASAYGIQYLTVPNTVGCDSIFFLDLTVNYTTYGEMSAVSCDSYEWDWNSAIYTASGDYTYRDTVNQNSQFCDSVLTLHLTINHSATSDTTATACDLFLWYGNMGYDVSGDYEHQWWNVTADGCDSILTLHLTINYSTETTVTDTAEGSYSWHGTTYTESGTYTWNGTTAEGCDSTVTLLLTITPTQAITQSSIQAIKIYPNPTSDLLTIDADDILSVELFDLNGRLVFSSEVDSSPFTFRLSPFTLNAGSYLLRIHTRQGTAVQHVILN